MINEWLTEPEQAEQEPTCVICGKQNDGEYYDGKFICDNHTYKELRNDYIKGAAARTNILVLKHRSKKAVSKIVEKHCYQNALNDTWEWMKYNMYKIYE